MKKEAVSGLLLPFLGTMAGSACVFFMKHNLSKQVQRSLTGFAAGVMTAASIWSLIIPAMNRQKAKESLLFCLLWQDSGAEFCFCFCLIR